MKRAKLVKMKNGKHRVASRSEAKDMQRICDLEASLKVSECSLKVATAEVRRARQAEAKLAHDIEVRDMIAEAIASKFAENAMPIVEQLLAATRNEKGKVGRFDEFREETPSAIIFNYRGRLPEIVYCFSEGMPYNYVR